MRHEIYDTAGKVIRIEDLPEPDPNAEDVREEAQRRMLQLVGARNAAHLETIISNGLREQGRLQAIRTGIPGLISAREWTAEETARAQALWAADQAIEAIRAASNTMETSPPIDFMDDARWPRDAK